MRLILLVVLLSLCLAANTQNSSQDVTKDKSRYAFGQIYTGFRYGFKDTYKPQAAFEFNQGIIGYYHQISEEVSGKIIYDVTRTTHFFEITDTAGNQLSYSYFEGSKYTAYLKMAEIKWDFHHLFALRVGQLLSTQYLTFQDKFWGFRYIDVTEQEKFRMGMPADFGAQLDFTIKGKFLNQFSIVNGEGPFRYQDFNGKFLFSNNIQYNPIEHLTLKLYVDYAPNPDTVANTTDKYVVSGFAGYKTDKFWIGSEYNFVWNYGFVENTDYSGLSFYGAYAISSKMAVLGRYDYLIKTMPDESTSLDYYIVGMQYEPVKQFTSSVNFRYYSVDALPFVYVNFGLKF